MNKNINIIIISFLAISLFQCNSAKGLSPLILLLLNSAENPATQPENNIICIDPSVPASGNGSQDKPYKYWSDVVFQSGKTYAQKKGTVAREEIVINASGEPGNPIILGAYGTGNDPIIQGSELETGWTLVNGSLYSKNFDASCVLGMVAEDGAALTYLAWNTDYTTTFAGASAGSFSLDYNTKTLYVWCTSGTPADHQMEVSRRKRGIAGQGISNVIIQDLKVQYASLTGMDIGACGILTPCAGGETCGNVTIKNCTVTKCGGTRFGAPYNCHLGNGIQFANGAANCRVENCVIADIFDSGITPQVYSDGQSQSAIVIANTIIERCGFAGIEIAGLNNLGTTGSISDVTVEKVAVSGSGKGWSGDRSEEYGDPQAIGIKIAADVGSDLSNIKIEQSSISGCGGHAVWLFGDVGTVAINRTKISNNDGNGIAALDINSVSLKLVVTSTLIFNNIKNGILFDVLNGQGYMLYNNTFYNNSNYALIVNNNNGIARVKNNIFSAPGIAHVVCTNPGADILYDYNCYDGTGSGGFIGYGGSSYSNLADFRGGTVHEDNGLQADPVFSNPAAGDLSLQSTSPCRGKGDASVGITQDYAGNTFKNPPSIGAYEY